MTPLAALDPDERRARRSTQVSAVWIVVWVVLTIPVVRAGVWRGGAAGWLGVAVAILTCATLNVAWFRGLAGLRWGRRLPDRIGWVCLAIGLAGMVLDVVTLGRDGLQMTIFLAVSLGLALPWTWAIGPVVVLAGLLWVGQGWFPSWGATHGEALGLLGSGIGCIFGRLSTERGIVARRMTAHAHELEISEERNRMARDLHDILGHSLTVISLKSELAGKLVGADPQAARRELLELQQLARSALADVRATVNNYREISLAGEIARAANTLASAGIKADLPTSVEVVDPQLRELFGWALREAVTNVVRHSGATSCRVTLGGHQISVTDDGVGIQAGGDGHGLEGLRERCRQQGATLHLGPGPGARGTTLTVRARTADELLAGADSTARNPTTTNPTTTNPTTTRTTR